MIILRDISLRRGPRLLLQEAGATLQPGQRLALIGANGCGKSSLFSLLLGELPQDAGDIEGLDKLRIAHMAQQTAATTMPALEYVWRGDSALAQLRDRIAALEDAGDYERAAPLHGQLEDLGSYSAERRGQRLLQGLGFADGDMQRGVSEFSGGWRIRLNLARALMTPSDLLLLDEPTNHLDLDATLWLQQWIQQYPGTLLLISHDRDFIDATCERVLHIEHQRLYSYKGNYSDFERLRAERLSHQQAMHEKQQRRAAEIDAFVQRFRYKASKARQAQSRLKELERMQLAAPAHADSPFDFSFRAPPRSSDPLLRLDEARLGYGDTAVLERVELILRPGSRIGLLGRNGAGKSTLLKSLVGDLPLLGGTRSAGEHCRVGYFDQQQLEALDMAASPALHLRRLTPTAREQEIFDFLGGFNFRGAVADEAIAPFSGGEKARLALALLVWQQPNLLVLDEPTNHLDLDMRHALEVALQSFDGALVLVSHDRHMLRNSVEELFLVHDGRVAEYRGDLQEYERWVLASIRDSDKSSGKEPATPTGSDKSNDRGNEQANDSSRREQRQQAAARREQLRPLQRALEKTERGMAEVEQELAEVQQRLGDSALYDEGRKDELAELLRREGLLKSRGEELDAAWLEQQEALEALQQ